MRFTGLDAGKDAQVGEFVAAAGQISQVSLDVERCHPRAVTDARGSGDFVVVLVRVFQRPVGEVDVLGERQTWKTEFNGTRARRLH